MRRLTLTLASATLLAAIAVAPTMARQPGPSIVDAAVQVNATTGEFDHLIAAVVRADLLETLDGNRQFTVFAPTDAAFEELFGILGVDGVDEIPLDTLTAVLLYHVAPGERFSGDVVGANRIRTLQRGFIEPSVVEGVAYVDDAAIVAADIDVANGVIHVIDAVLLP
jgi:transforming growth factor-beta-induced protein